MTDPSNVEPDEPEFYEILTKRLRLRTVRVADTELIMPLITRPEVMYWTSQGPMENVEQGRKWVSARVLGRDCFNFAIEERRDATEGSQSPPPIVGLAGCYHPPEIGYMIHPDYAGKGYATEALQAFVPEIFQRFPSANEGGIGFDHLEGWVDSKNGASRRILEKTGFVFCETHIDSENQIRGPCELLIFRKARPGKTLEGLGLIPKTEAESDGPPSPPVQ